jgi:hypothetical protein
MTTTTTAYPSSMSVAGIASEVERLTKLGGPKMEVFFSIGHDRLVASLMIYETGMLGDRPHYIKHDNFPALFAEAEVWIRGRAGVRRNATIRTLALAIIELTDEHGRCTAKLLRGKRFSAEDISEFKDAACARASEMAGMAPYSVVA